jgi:hypothetical protein
MAKTAHLLVTALSVVVASALWLLLFVADKAFAWHLQDGAVGELAQIAINLRLTVFLVPAVSTISTAILWRRRKLSLEAALIHLLILLLVCVAMFGFAGAGMIVSRNLMDF